jgi:glycosyltransferase involved in cell wall biosynthesis
LRIVELNPFYLPYDGGIEKRITAIASNLSARHEIYVLTSRLPGTMEREEIGGATVIRLPSTYTGKYNPPMVRSEGVLDALKMLKADVVDYHYRWAHSYNSAFFRYSGNRVITFHNQYGEGTGLLAIASRLNDFLYLRKMKGIQVMTISDFVRNQLTGRGIDGNMVQTVEMGIDIREHTTGDDGFALFIGRLVPTKGIGHLVEAAVETGIPLRIAGAGPMLEKLKKKAKGGSVEFLGRVDEEQKEKLLSRCSFLVMPSLQESFGVALLEGMEHGKAVIASTVGGLAAVAGNAGILVPPGDTGAVASAMKRLWNDVELRSSLGRNARKRAETYSWDNIVLRIEAVYSSLCDTGA